jgi:hypothetical protein
MGNRGLLSREVVVPKTDIELATKSRKTRNEEQRAESRPHPSGAPNSAGLQQRNAPRFRVFRFRVLRVFVALFRFLDGRVRIDLPLDAGIIWPVLLKRS